MKMFYFHFPPKFGRYATLTLFKEISLFLFISQLNIPLTDNFFFVFCSAEESPILPLMYKDLVSCREIQKRLNLQTWQA